MSVSIIGTCSICGGRVTVPTFFHSVVPPTPTCESCGAVAASHGPVIPMRPAPRRLYGTGTTTVPEWLVVPTRTVPGPNYEPAPALPWPTPMPWYGDGGSFCCRA